MALVSLSCFSSATRSSGMGELDAVAGAVVPVVDVGAFAAGALTFGVAGDVEGVVTGGFKFDGTSFLAGAALAGAALTGAAGGGAGGGEGGFRAAASSVFSGVTGGGTGADSGDETAAGGGFSVPREHALSPSTTAAIKQIRVDNITVTSSSHDGSYSKWSFGTTKWRSSSHSGASSLFPERQMDAIAKS